ncbi:hypothetical protein [Paractinoplanes toevensis]|uniref:Uncharacterized protein n=1 Tax=Paractinoplanes toevensis TaxID=571911 RepID=A0A919VYC3_9ACTN|nr:hypothetical protein [Actinoplanes toevensis]GIM88847.1 hypothetical protein Ato02nite_006400 [Actinoplanes toevensis]
MRSIRPIVAIGLGLALVASTAACSTRPPVDEVWLYYMNGSVDKKEFKECIDPNTKGPWQANNDTFALPTSLRTWNVAPTGGDTSQPTIVGSKPGADGQAGPQMDVWTTVEFYLNTNCDGGKGSPVVQFWEKTGRRYGVSNGSAELSEEGWDKVLANTLVPVQAKAMQRVARAYSADEMDTNVLTVDPKVLAAATPDKPVDREVWKKMEDAMAEEFTEQLRAKVGGDYFCGAVGTDKAGAPITYDRKTGVCPAVRVSITDINYHDPALQAKRAEVRAAAEDAKKKLIEAQSQTAVSAELAKAAKSPEYLRLKELETWLAGIQACAQNANCTTFVGEPGSVAVSTK